MIFDPDLKPRYLQVVDCSPTFVRSWQPYGRWELPQKLPADVFWRIVAIETKRMVAHMVSMGVPVERLQWDVQVSLLTYGQLYDYYSESENLK